MQIGLKTMTLLTGLVLAVAGCTDSTNPGEDEEQDGGFVVRGSVQNNTQSPVPSNARVLLAWVLVDDSAPYSYVFGEGTIDPDGESFEATVEGDLPQGALYAGDIGVAVIVATTNQTISTGDDLLALSEAQIIGGAEDYGVIHLDGSGAAGLFPWAGDFEAGYTVGVGGPVGSQGYETFVPSDPSGVVLVIDDVENLDFVDWT